MEKAAITAAARSMREWIASETMLTDPLARPIASFMAMSDALERIDSLAYFAARLTGPPENPSKLLARSPEVNIAGGAAGNYLAFANMPPDSWSGADQSESR